MSSQVALCSEQLSASKFLSSSFVTCCSHLTEEAAARRLIGNPFLSFLSQDRCSSLGSSRLGSTGWLAGNYTAGLKENKLHVTKLLCVPTDQRVSQKQKQFIISKANHFAAIAIDPLPSHHHHND